MRSAKIQARKYFLYLTGETGPSSSSAYPFLTGADTSTSGHTPQPPRRETQIGRTESGGGLWASITGLFSGIGRNASGGGFSGTGRDEEGKEVYDEGEVHCDLVKVGPMFTTNSNALLTGCQNDSGNFEWRYIIVDMPSTCLLFRQCLLSTDFTFPCIDDRLSCPLPTSCLR